MTEGNVVRLMQHDNDLNADETMNATLALLVAGGAALRMLVSILPESARNVETASCDLTEKFKKLAGSATQQGQMVQQLIENVRILDVEGKRFTIEEFIGTFETTLDDSISRMLFVSKQALAMVYNMQDAIRELKEIEHFTRQIQEITKRSNLLALNALIESARAGAAGQGFSVVANEMKELSGQIATLSSSMNSRTGRIMNSMTGAFSLLQDVATQDMQANIDAKDKLESLMMAMIRQAEESMRVMQGSADASRNIADAISGMVVDLQFQDRNTQVTDNAIDIIGECLAMFDAMGARAELLLNGQTDVARLAEVQGAVASIFSVIRLGDIRQRYADILKQIGVEQPVDKNRVLVAAAEDIELF